MNKSVPASAWVLDTWYRKTAYVVGYIFLGIMALSILSLALNGF